MARLLFDIFYDEECVSKDTFFEWLKHPDQSETEGKIDFTKQKTKQDNPTIVFRACCC